MRSAVEPDCIGNNSPLRGHYIQGFRPFRSTALRLSVLLALFSKLHHFLPRHHRILPLLSGPEARSPYEDPVLPVEGLAILETSVLFAAFNPSASQPSQRI